MIDWRIVKKHDAKRSYVSSCRIQRATLRISSKRLNLKQTDKIDMKERKRKREMYTQRNGLACEALECSFDLSFEIYATSVQFDFCSSQISELLTRRTRLFA